MILPYLLSAALSATTPASVVEDSAPDYFDGHRFEIFAGGGVLGNNATTGSAGILGTRFRLARYVAFSFDLGYGLLPKDTDLQDRWWLIPAVEVSLPVDRLRFDLGVGVGFGSSSYYVSDRAYFQGPFDPAWALQLIPTVRGFATVGYRMDTRVSLFVRFDVASMVLDHNSIGSRVGNANPALPDTSWALLWVGVDFSAL